jgi:hypothetical protein
MFLPSFYALDEHEIFYASHIALDCFDDRKEFCRVHFFHGKHTSRKCFTPSTVLSWYRELFILQSFHSFILLLRFLPPGTLTLWWWQLFRFIPLFVFLILKKMIISWKSNKSLIFSHQRYISINSHWFGSVGRVRM